jgi:hypothetical protein
MRRLVVCHLVLALTGLCAPAPAAAQGGVSTAFTRLFIDTDPRLSVLSEVQLAIIRRVLAIGISTFPAESGSASFAEFNLLDPSPPARSLGPAYLLQSVPLPPGAFSAFAAYRRAVWTSLDAIHLDSGQLRNQTPAFFNRPAIDTRTSLDLVTDTLAIVVNQGLPARINVGASVPLHRVCVGGGRVTEGMAPVDVHGCSTGIGDVALKAKLSQPAGRYWFAGEASVSLPTGSVDDLRGRGQAQTTLLLAASRPAGPVQPHVNGGVVLGGHGVRFDAVDFFGTESLIIARVTPSRAVQYGAGADYIPSPRMTINVEVIGRVLRHGASFRSVDVLNGSSLEATPVAWQRFVLAAVGVKFELREGLLVHGHLTKQVSTAGLRAPLVAGVALEYGIRRASE